MQISPFILFNKIFKYFLEKNYIIKTKKTLTNSKTYDIIKEVKAVFYFPCVCRGDPIEIGGSVSRILFSPRLRGCSNRSWWKDVFLGYSLPYHYGRKYCFKKNKKKSCFLQLFFIFIFT